MVVSIQGRHMYLWRVVDAESEVLEVLLQVKRDTKAARKLMRKLLKRQRMAPDEWVMDKNPAYGAALRELRLTRAPQGLSRWGVFTCQRRRHGPQQVTHFQRLSGFVRPGPGRQNDVYLPNVTRPLDQFPVEVVHRTGNAPQC
jgi:transposase-like protein